MAEQAGPWDDVRIAAPREEDWPAPYVPAEGKRGGLFACCEYAAVRFAQSALFHLPAAPRRRAIEMLARLARRLDRRHGTVAREFVRTARPELDQAGVERHVLGAYRQLLRLMVAHRGLSRLVGSRLGDHYDVEVSEDARRVIASGAGCLLVTAHVGNWDAVTPPLAAMGLGPLYAIGKPMSNVHLARYVQRARERFGGRLLPRRGAMKSVPAVLRAGGSVVMLLDQRPLVKPVVVPFFGRPAWCDRTAAVLVRRLAVPVVFMACYSTDELARFEFRMPGVIWPEELEGLSPEEVTVRINRGLEELILARPEQYYWLHNRYKRAPRAPEDSSAGSTSGDSVSNRLAHGA